MNRLEVLMYEIRSQVSNGSWTNPSLMHGSILEGTARAPAHQAHRAVGIPPHVPKPLAQEDHPAIDKVCVVGHMGVLNCSCDLSCELRGDDLIRVEKENPVILKREILPCPILLRGVPRPPMGDKYGSHLTSNAHGLVGRSAVNYEDLTRPRNRPDTSLDMQSFVKGGDDH
jgi:hypothetical protein